MRGKGKSAQKRWLQPVPGAIIIGACAQGMITPRTGPSSGEFT